MGPNNLIIAAGSRSPITGSIGAELERRRWRILQAALPVSRLPKIPASVRTFDQFIWWVAGELSGKALHAYLEGLEEMALLTCDLVLLRLARDYMKDRV